MQLQHVLPAATDLSVASSFVVSFVSDTGVGHNVMASGRQLEQPLAFAAFATEQSGEVCTSPVGSDAGAWHSLLGQLLGRHEGSGARSNLVGSVEFSGAGLEESRRQALLSASCLGSTVTRTPETPAVVVAPDTRSEHERFLDRVRTSEDAQRRERTERLAPALERTAIGRDVLGQSRR